MSTETSVLEIVETKQDSHDRGPLLHIYCIPCMEAVSPEKIPPYCGLGRPANNDMMLYPSIEQAPPRDVCVVCLDIMTCPRCGE